MRMWMVNPVMMCQQHLLGEHVELHMFVGTLKKKINIRGYIDNNLLEPCSIKTRHDELVKEMKKRGLNHKSPLVVPDLSYLTDDLLFFKIDEAKSLADLRSRCPKCAHLYETKVFNSHYYEKLESF